MAKLFKNANFHTNKWNDIKSKHPKDWENLKSAFGEIINTSLHGKGTDDMSDKEVEKHFKNALSLTRANVGTYQEQIDNLLKNKDSDKNNDSPYYLVNTAHDREDQFYAPNQTETHIDKKTNKKVKEETPSGKGNQTLVAKFEAQNIYEKYAIDSSHYENINHEVKTRLGTKGSPFPQWETIYQVMTNSPQFHKQFKFDKQDEAKGKKIFELVSNWNWDKVKGELFLTPEIELNQVFSPALFAVYFFRTPEKPKENVFVIVSADGGGHPQKSFIGIANNPTLKPEERKIYKSSTRYAFTPLSSPDNLMNYWLDMHSGEQGTFTLGIETFFPNRPKHSYLKVTTDFCAKISEKDVDFIYKKNPLLKTFLMLIKGTLMRDLVKAYYPNHSSVQNWSAIGLFKKKHPLFDALIAAGLDCIAGLFDISIWKEKPTIWRNWHKTIGVGGPVRKEFAPNNGDIKKKGDIQSQEFTKGLNSLLNIVQTALKDPNEPKIRAYGSKWSLNNAAYTEDYLVKTWGLDYAKIGLDSSYVASKYESKSRELCFVQAGVMVKSLNVALKEKDLALQTTGASDGQRLVGAISTGTHGSAMGFGAMQDFVKGIHLVVPDGNNVKHIFLQRESDQAVNPKFAKFLDNAEFKCDDELFNAALVSFGCFGLIHGVLIETEKIFSLRYQTIKFDPAPQNKHLPNKENLWEVLKKPTIGNLNKLTKLAKKERIFKWLDDKTPNAYPYFFSANINPFDRHNVHTYFFQVMIKETYNSKVKMEGENNKKYEKHEAIHLELLNHKSQNSYHNIEKNLFKNIEKDIFKYLEKGLELSLLKEKYKHSLNYNILSDLIQEALIIFHQGQALMPVNSGQVSKLSSPDVIFNTKHSADSTTHVPWHSTSTEIAVPISKLRETVRLIRKIMKNDHKDGKTVIPALAAPLGIRYLPSTSLATLAFNQIFTEDKDDNFGLIATIELPGPQQGSHGIFPDAKKAHKAIFEALKAENIPHRFHWGQQYPLNTDWVKKGYGDTKITSWKKARKEILTTPKAQNMFANKLTDAIGLTKFEKS
jgi:hypothetical protein